MLETWISLWLARKPFCTVLSLQACDKDTEFARCAKRAKRKKNRVPFYCLDTPQIEGAWLKSIYHSYICLLEFCIIIIYFSSTINPTHSKFFITLHLKMSDFPAAETREAWPASCACGRHPEASRTARPCVVLPGVWRSGWAGGRFLDPQKWSVQKMMKWKFHTFFFEVSQKNHKLMSKIGNASFLGLLGLPWVGSPVSLAVKALHIDNVASRRLKWCSISVVWLQNSLWFLFSKFGWEVSYVFVVCFVYYIYI